MQKKASKQDQDTIINPLDAYLGYHLRRISAASMSSLTTNLKELEIRPSEATVILFIESNPGVLPSIVGKHLGIGKPNMTPMINKLESKQLCQRTPLDGRSTGLKLSRKGLAFAQKIKLKITENEKLSFGQLSAKEKKIFLNTLNRLNSSLSSS